MKSAFVLGLFLIQPAFAASLTPPGIDVTNFLPSLKTVLEDIRSQEFNSVACPNYLKTFEDSVLRIDVRKISTADFNRDAQAIADISWKIREALHERLPEFDLTCINQVQSNFRQFRFVEEYVMEHLTQVHDLYPEGRDFQKEAMIPMKDVATYYVFNRRTSDEALKNKIDFIPGDLMIARGLSFLSAMIARLGDRGTQFSHVVMLAEDGPVTSMEKVELPRSQRTLESYVGSGVGFYQIDDALKNENARLLWLRSKDEELGRNAAKIMGDEVTRLLQNNDKIYYDYSMDFENHETMSCAEVAQTAYERASSGKVHIPMYENEITGGASLLTHLGLPQGKTFEPGDMEIDPRFELMGEFKDLRLTRDSRHKDVIMTKIFQWMNERNYELHDNLKSKMAGGLIWNLRRTFMWPAVKKLLKLSDFSKEIPRKMVRTVALLGDVGAPMLERIRAADETFKAKTGWSMTYQELYQVMEDFRAEDEELYQNRKTRKLSKFHKMFRAN